VATQVHRQLLAGFPKRTCEAPNLFSEIAPDDAKQLHWTIDHGPQRRRDRIAARIEQAETRGEDGDCVRRHVVSLLEGSLT
jgi:hypothetical protein